MSFHASAVTTYLDRVGDPLSAAEAHIAGADDASPDPANLCGHRTREAGRRHAIRVADQGGEVDVGLRASLTAGEALEAELSRSCALSFYDQRVVHLARPHRNADHGDRPGGVREPPGTAGNRHLAR